MHFLRHQYSEIVGSLSSVYFCGGDCVEDVAPAHRTLAVGGQPVEHLVEVPADVVADGNHDGVREADARTVFEARQVQEHHQRKEHPRHELDETVVRYGFGEIGLHVE